MNARYAPRAAGLGIDFGGTGIKAALIDMSNGRAGQQSRCASTRHDRRRQKRSLRRSSSIVAIVGRDHAIPEGIPVGIGLPGVVKRAEVMTAANIDKAWIGTSADEVIGTAIGRRVYAINDADAAGLAEVRLGAGRDVRGTVLMLTVGTGIGSGLFLNGQLVANTEFGHLEVNGRDAETRISGAARERRRLRWKAWANGVQRIPGATRGLPVAGSDHPGRRRKQGHREDTATVLKSRAPIAMAQYRNTSGIIGATINAADRRRDDAVRSAAAVALPSSESRALNAADTCRGPSSGADRRPLAGPSSRRDVRALPFTFRAPTTGSRPGRQPDQRHGGAD